MTGRIRVWIPANIMSALAPSERLWTPETIKTVIMEVENTSYDSAARFLNHVLRRDNNEMFSPRTLQDTILHNGDRAIAELSDIASGILEKNGFDPNTGLPVSKDSVPQKLCLVEVSDEEKAESQKRIEEAVERFNSKTENGCQIQGDSMISQIETVPQKTVYVMLDDICASHQKEKRTVSSHKGFKGAERVETTVVYLKSSEGEYRLAAKDVPSACRLTVAFLLTNGLLENRELVFFTDGARTLQNNIDKYFAFHPHSVHLDWFHIRKKCREYLSMALIGGKINREKAEKVKYELSMKIWPGNTMEAIDYLRNVDSSLIKNQKQMDELIRYLERKQAGITCFALRKELGLINSSARVEKSNDLLMAKRQKNQGMSWSHSGSLALAVITALDYNKELDSWSTDRTIHFQLIA